MIDIQERLRSGKGPAYERWAKVYNLKQMAAALQYLKEHGIADYDELAAGSDAAVERSHKLAAELQAVEAELAQTADLMGAVVDYAKAWKSNRMLSWYIFISPLYYFTFRVRIFERSTILYIGSILFHVLVTCLFN